MQSYKFLLLPSLFAILFYHSFETKASAQNQHKTYTREEIEHALEIQWTSLSTLTLTCDEFPVDESGNRIANKTYIRYDYLMGDSHQRKILSRAFSPNGTVRLLEEVRSNGREEYTLKYSSKSPYDLQFIQSKPQTSLRNNYRGSKFSVLWLMFPDGKPLIDNLKSGAEITNDSTNPNFYPIIKFKRELDFVECKLDPKHDWLPISTSLINSSYTITYVVSEFGIADGRYYPKSGTYNNPTSSKSLPRGFQVSSFAFNSSIPERAFEKPPLTPGVSYNDPTGRILSTEKSPKLQLETQNMKELPIDTEWPKSSHQVSFFENLLLAIQSWIWVILASIAGIFTIIGLRLRSRKS